VQLIHLAVIPIAWLLFKREPDGGHGIGKIFGLVLVSYISWIAPQTLHVPYTRSTIFTVVLLIALISAGIFIAHLKQFREHFKRTKFDLLIVEILFAVAFFVFVGFRMYNPEISYDVNLYAAEKFPDMVFYHAICNYDYLPPPDLWFSGEGNSINYYYYGYFIQANITKLAGIEPAIGYNLSLSLIFALSVLGAYSLIFNLASGIRAISPRTSGVLAALVLVVMGNLYGAVHMETGQPFGPLEIWEGSRVIEKETIENGITKEIDKTINEFPAFSFILGDLHAHLLALPMSLLVIHLLMSITRVRGTIFRRDELLTTRLLLAGAYILSLGSLICGNYWDLPTYYLLSIWAFLLAGWTAPKDRVLAIVSLESVAFVSYPLIRFVIFQPFFRHYNPPPAEIDILESLHRTAIGQFLTIHGFLLFLVISMMFLLWLRFSEWSVKMIVALIGILPALIAGIGFGSWMIGLMTFVLCFSLSLAIVVREMRYVIPLALTSMAAGVLVGCEFIYIKDFYGFPNTRMNTVFKFYYQAWIFLAVAGAWGWASFRTQIDHLRSSGKLLAIVIGSIALIGLASLVVGSILSQQPLLFAVLASVIILCLSLVHLMNYRRYAIPIAIVLMGSIIFINFSRLFGLRVASTAFQLSLYEKVYVVFALIGILGWSSWRLLHHQQSAGKYLGLLFESLAMLGLGASLIYTVQAVPIKADNFKPMLGRPTLNGFAYIKERYPGDYRACEWLQENAKPGEVIVEATGAPYSYYGRVAAMSGLPTLLGWGNHQSLWRDWTWKLPGERTNDIRTIYKSLDIKEVLTVFDKYAVVYVFCGTLEQKDFYEYDINGREKFNTIMDLVYDRNDVQIFRRKLGITAESAPIYQRNPKLIIPKEQGKLVVNEEGVQELLSKSSILSIGGNGTNHGMFISPHDIAVGADGALFITDTSNHRVQKFDANGQFMAAWGTAGEGDGQFNQPVGITVDTEGFVYVADTWNHRIQKFDSEGNFIAKWGGPSVFWAPKDLVVDEEGRIYVVDTGYHRLHIFTRDFHELKVWGEKGNDPGQFFEPVGITFGPKGELLVADTANKRISVYSRNGNHQADWFVIGWDEFYTEPFLVMDPAGYIIVSDSYHNRLQIYGVDGKLMAVWPGSDNPSVSFNRPIGLALDRERNLYVADGVSHRMYKFAPLDMASAQIQ